MINDYIDEMNGETSDEDQDEKSHQNIDSCMVSA